MKPEDEILALRQRITKLELALTKCLHLITARIAVDESMDGKLKISYADAAKDAKEALGSEAEI